MLMFETIKEAQRRICSFVHRTPVITSRSFNERVGREVFFKCENLQRAGAFKIRGATNKILALSEDERGRGVVAFSSGNHAQAVALAARDANTRAVIAMPTDAPQTKVIATRGYGAEVRFYDRQRDDRELFARNIAESESLTLVPPYDDYLVMAGQGTCALELLEDVPDLDSIVTPCGGGGLFAGASTAAKAINERIRLFAVEAEGADDTLQSLRRGERVCIPPPATIADGMRNQAPGALTFPVLQRNAEDVLLISDDEIIETMRFILFRMKLVVEPTGATAAAAVLFGKLPGDVRRIGVVLSGGNVDPSALAAIASS
ncbi:MAG: threonine/serine dehydratase [Pyrinomonadaceae bacterium]|nr:threonine/serine dehydratase [Pyrinomonadaceae bacterium]